MKIAVFPGFSTSDWRTFELAAPSMREEATVELWTKEATRDHRDGSHVGLTHPFCDECEDRRLAMVSEVQDWTDEKFMRQSMYSGERINKRALRFLRLHGRLPAKAVEEGPQAPADGGFLRELLDRPNEPSWRVEGLIPADAGTLVVAARKTGKTTFNLNLARSFLTGEDLLGRFGVKPIEGIVTVLNFEVSGATFARWADEHGVDKDRLYVENLRGRRNPFRHPEDRLALAEKLRMIGTETLIVDPFGRAFTGNSQNDTGEVTAWLVALDEFARTEVGARDVILNAHAGWNGERTRGSSALEDWADVFVTMTRDADDDAQRFLKAEGRDVLLDEDRLDFDPSTRTLSLSGVGSRRQIKDTAKISELAVLVVRAARQNPGASQRAIEGFVKAMDDAPTFRNGDVAKAAKHAEKHGHLRIDRAPSGNGFRFTALDPTAPNRSHTDPGDHSLTAPTAPNRGAVAVAVSGVADDVLDVGAVNTKKEAS